jgi:RNA recognition motif-containing protein
LELNETEQFGRNIFVEQAQGAKSNNDRGAFQKGGNQRGSFGGQNKFQDQGNADIKTNTLFIGGLSYNSTVESIQDYFKGHGDVQRARIVTDRETGKVIF